LNYVNQLARQEFKYFISSSELIVLRSLLKHIMKLDHYADPHTRQYKVTSLYFETPESQDLQEKIDGINQRSKYRVRQYNHDGSVIKFEIKKKCGNVIEKKSAMVDHATVLELCKGSYEVLKNIDNKFLNDAYIRLKIQGYQPKVIVEYDREAYTLPYGNIRISFDRNLVTYNTDTNLLDIKTTGVPVLDADIHILEVKSSIGIPTHIRKIIQQVSATRTAASKYVFSRRFTDHHRWRDTHNNPF